MNHGNPSIDDVMKILDKYEVGYSPSSILHDLEWFVRSAKKAEAFASDEQWRRSEEGHVYDSYGNYIGRR